MDVNTMETNNHTEWHDEQLSRRLAELTEINQPWQKSRERLRQIQDEMALVNFEQICRYGETHE
jgi:hypothetical protein